jgi:hypothetical protein
MKPHCDLNTQQRRQQPAQLGAQVEGKGRVQTCGCGRGPKAFRHYACNAEVRRILSAFPRLQRLSWSNKALSKKI